jgi:hypothetical protein
MVTTTTRGDVAALLESIHSLLFDEEVVEDIPFGQGNVFATAGDYRVLNEARLALRAWVRAHVVWSRWRFFVWGVLATLAMYMVKYMPYRAWTIMSVIFWGVSTLDVCVSGLYEYGRRSEGVALVGRVEDALRWIPRTSPKAA